MVRSQTAVRRGIANTPGKAEIAALTLLCERVLEPVRVHYDRPVIVSSGYRAPKLNRAIGGSSSSQHCSGEASDFTVLGVSNFDVCNWMHRNLDYDQLIYEFGEAGWIHASYSEGQMRNQELTALRSWRGRTIYKPGIVA
jgi:hypothetical protein